MTHIDRPEVFERILIDMDAREFGTLERYLGDPSYRAQHLAEQQVERDKINAQFDAHRDADLIRLGYIDAPATSYHTSENSR